MSVGPPKFDCQVLAFTKASLFKTLTESRCKALKCFSGPAVKKPDHRHRRLLRARRERPRCSRAAECSQQFPPSDGDCHTPLPCEVRKGNDTTPRGCRLHVQGAGCWLLPP